VVVTVQELVEVLEHATSDPQIVALFGTFGGGSSFTNGGPAVAEQIRNALKIFRESHRCHPEPNFVHHNNNSSSQDKMSSRRQPRPLYAYAVSSCFASFEFFGMGVALFVLDRSIDHP
jgi:hypothetical protein